MSVALRNFRKGTLHSHNHTILYDAISEALKRRHRNIIWCSRLSLRFYFLPSQLDFRVYEMLAPFSKLANRVDLGFRREALALRDALALFAQHELNKIDHVRGVYQGQTGQLIQLFVSLIDELQRARTTRQKFLVLIDFNRDCASLFSSSFLAQIGMALISGVVLGGTGISLVGVMAESFSSSFFAMEKIYGLSLGVLQGQATALGVVGLGVGVASAMVGVVLARLLVKWGLSEYIQVYDALGKFQRMVRQALIDSPKLDRVQPQNKENELTGENLIPMLEHPYQMIRMEGLRYQRYSGVPSQILLQESAWIFISVYPDWENFNRLKKAITQVIEELYLDSYPMFYAVAPRVVEELSLYDATVNPAGVKEEFRGAEVIVPIVFDPTQNQLLFTPEEYKYFLSTFWRALIVAGVKVDYRTPNGYEILCLNDIPTPFSYRLKPGFETVSNFLKDLYFSAEDLRYFEIRSSDALAISLRRVGYFEAHLNRVEQIFLSDRAALLNKHSAHSNKLHEIETLLQQNDEYFWQQMSAYYDGRGAVVQRDVFDHLPIVSNCTAATFIELCRGALNPDEVDRPRCAELRKFFVKFLSAVQIEMNLLIDKVQHPLLVLLQDKLTCYPQELQALYERAQHLEQERKLYEKEKTRSYILAKNHLQRRASIVNFNASNEKSFLRPNLNRKVYGILASLDIVIQSYDFGFNAELKNLGTALAEYAHAQLQQGVTRRQVQQGCVGQISGSTVALLEDIAGTSSPRQRYILLYNFAEQNLQIAPTQPIHAGISMLIGGIVGAVIGAGAAMLTGFLLGGVSAIPAAALGAIKGWHWGVMISAALGAISGGRCARNIVHKRNALGYAVEDALREVKRAGRKAIFSAGVSRASVFGSRPQSSVASGPGLGERETDGLLMRTV